MSTDLQMLLVLLVGGIIVATCAALVAVAFVAVRFYVTDHLHRDRRPISPVVPLEAVRPATEIEQARARRDARRGGGRVA